MTTEHRRVEKPIVTGYFVESSAFLDLERWSLRDIANAIRGRWFWLVGALFTGFLAGFGYFLLADRVYRVEVMAIPISTTGEQGASALRNVSGLASLAGLSIPQEQTELNAALAYAQSRQFAREFVSDRDLTNVFFPPDRVGKLVSWMTPKSPTLGDAVDVFQKRILRITRDRDDGTIAFQVEWRDPVLAAEWANDIVQRVDNYIRQLAIDEATKSLDFLDHQLSQTTIVELKAAIYGLIESNVRARMIASVRDAYVLRVVDPAMPPDPDKYVRPKFLANLATGMILTGLLAFCAALFWRRKSAFATNATINSQ